MPKLSIIIPCYNESKTIALVIESIMSLNLLRWQKEVIVINDGSTDGSTEILNKLKQDFPEIHVSHLSVNKGKGTAVKQGLELATGDFVLIQDADLEYSPTDIPILLNKATNNNTIVLGSRNLSPNTKKGKLIPRAGVYFITRLINLLYKQSLTDVWTCYKLFPRETIPLFTPGHFDSEIIFLLESLEKKYIFHEVPISYNPRTKAEGKKIRYRDGFIIIMKIIYFYLTRKLTK